MKRKIFFAAVLVVSMLAFTACGKKTVNPLTGYTSGDVTLGKYKDIEYTPAAVEVTDEEVEETIDTRLIKANPEYIPITDHTVVAEGDMVNIDYEGLRDGVAFEGGTASGHLLTIGSGSFIEGFEEGLIGKSVGEETSLNLTFPETYERNPDLAGAAVVFNVKINSIVEAVDPELSDELVITATKDEYKSVEEYRTYIRENLTTTKQDNAKAQMENDILEAAVKGATFNKDLTAEIAETKTSLTTYYNNMTQSMYQVDAATYFYYFYGMDAASYESYIASMAEANVQLSYLLSAIAEEEEITITEEELTAGIADYLENYGYETEAELMTNLQTNYNVEDGKVIVEEQLKLNKAQKLMVDSGVAVTE